VVSNWLVAQGLKPASVNVAISATKSFYDFLVEKCHVKGNPMITKRLRIAEEQSLPAFLTEEERAVLAHIPTLPSHISLAFTTMLATRLRVSEAANLDPEDVLLQQGAVFLMVRHGKGSKERIVPVTDVEVARELLAFAQTREPGDNLFGVHAGTFKWHAREIRKPTGVDFHRHHLHHTLAT